ncbi:MAG: alpha-amylase family glycosyl hydrolase, partial [Bacteroidota bacterium]
MSAIEEVRSHLLRVYPPEAVDDMIPAIEALWQGYENPTRAHQSLTERDVALITYGDQVAETDIPKLQTLRAFLDEHLREVVTLVHLLPFYPYSSDDGFSVIDYYQVRSDLGDWDAVRAFTGSFDLMFDAVINQMSAESEWFQKYLADAREYKDFFIDGTDFKNLDLVTRPRTSPLLHQFNDKRVWTTFSCDQVDLNYAHPQVMLRILDLLLFYASHGAKAIRLDAIGFMWKEDGTTSIHLPEAHELI